MKLPVNPEFLNLDLELESSRSLAALSVFFAKSSEVLFNDRVGRSHRLTVEPLIRGKLNGHIGQCTNHFLKVLAELPPQLIPVWKGCKRRVLDYGFDGGLETAPLVVSLTNRQLSGIAELGLSITVTIYSFRENEPEPSALIEPSVEQ
ncbi:MAG: hypothetical protein IPK58_01855 [Acidobacteria bacterium]|nr:hypothetical protein [Acidobacteriota bacterium]